MELKNIITDLKNSLGSLILDLVKQKKIMNGIKNKSFQIIQSEEWKEKGIKTEWRKTKGLKETPSHETAYALLGV